MIEEEVVRWRQSHDVVTSSEKAQNGDGKGGRVLSHYGKLPKTCTVDRCNLAFRCEIHDSTILRFYGSTILRFYTIYSVENIK